MRQAEITTQDDLAVALAEIGVRPQPGTVPPIGIDPGAIPTMVRLLNEKGYEITVTQFTRILSSSD